MKKIFLLFISILLLTGCGKIDKDKMVKDFVNDVLSSKSYYTEAKMEIYNAEDTFKYSLKVSYLDEDYFKVDMLNTVNSHEQILLRDDDAVYVITPSLNKSYKFSSEWPYNSSQSYILSSLVRDIEEDDDIEFLEENDQYVLKVDVNYPNNNYLKYEKIYFDKSQNIKSVFVYDQDDILSIRVDFSKVDYKANLDKDDFSIDKLVSENCCNTNVNNYDSEEKEDVNNDENTTKNTGSLEDIIYPLYVPNNTYLKSKDLISSENGERAILTFNGDKSFVLIEETATVFDEFETIPVYGDPLVLMESVGAVTDNSLSWTVGNVNYYLTGTNLTIYELETIANSLTTETVMAEK